MKRSEFLRAFAALVASACAPRHPSPTTPEPAQPASGAAAPGTAQPPPAASSELPSHKHWVWIPTDDKTDDNTWKRSFERMRQAGVSAILPEVFNGREAHFRSNHLPVAGDWLGRILPLAKSAGLEVHAWSWCMPCNIDAIVKEHPEWYVVNGKGESAATKPAYVPYYKFLCPTREPVQAFVKRRIEELAQYPELDGIHLDYIRFPDVILAKGLQPKYDIVQDREYPEYDYCYCQVCRDTFKKQSGTDPMKLKDPSQNAEWRQFRQDRITHLVNEHLIPPIKRSGKLASAAVFPNWKNVRQEWHKWKLDAALPMLYNKFYEEDIAWIGEHTQAGVQRLPESTALYSGLFVHEMTPEQLTKAMQISLASGAKGVSVFSFQAMTEDHWQAFANVVQSRG